ncbi:MAG: hypothetical protein ACI36W_03135 [Coriobacteriales bacterium]
MAILDRDVLGSCSTARKLIESKIPSRVGAKDASVYGFSGEARATAEHRMGWADLASNPPRDPAEIAVLAQQARCEGLDAVVLIGQGGSTQAPQTITKLHSLEVTDEVPFRTMDSISPVYVNHILGSSDPARTLYIVSSKSGSTLEPTVLSQVAWSYVCAHLGADRAGRRFVAITDPGSQLEQIARRDGWRAVLHGEPDVGGRYSALSVFGLMPMACVGIDIEGVLNRASEVERLCASDSPDNPALQLACFLYDNYAAGRDKFSLLMPPQSQVFGLWVEQLVAESLGKRGVGILPNIEVDAGIIADPLPDRCVILCNSGNDRSYEHARTCLHPSIPAMRLDIIDSDDIAEHFLIWEYAVAFCGWLMEIDPFDQPDVESTKRAVKQILYGDGGEYVVPLDPQGNPAYVEYPTLDGGFVESVYVSSALLERMNRTDKVDLARALRTLFYSIKEGDYFSLNAFLPFKGVGRRETLERIRHRVADRLHACSCLEIGPRYLHSTGQLHKGGPDNGVFLVVSSQEPYDMTVPHEAFTLGEVANAQALGDFGALASRGRRAVYVRLKDNDSEYLQTLADAVCAAVSATYAFRRNGE